MSRNQYSDSRISFLATPSFVSEVGEAFGTACLFVIRPAARTAADELSGDLPARIIVWELTAQSKHALREREQPLRDVIALHRSSIRTALKRSNIKCRTE